MIFIVLSFGSEISSYGQLINSLDEGIEEALNYYRQSGEFPVTRLLCWKLTLYRMKANHSLDYAIYSWEFYTYYHLDYHDTRQYAFA